MKSLAPAAFPESDQLFPPDASAQRALPEASEVSTYPLVAPESIFKFWKLPVPTTTSLSVGLSVPIPICPPVRIVIFAVSFGPIWTASAMVLVIKFQTVNELVAEPVFDVPTANAQIPVIILLRPNA